MKILKLIILSLLVCSHCYGQNSGNQSYNAQKARQELAQIEALKDSIAKVKKAKQDSLRKDRLKKSIAAATNKNNGQCPPELRKSEAGRELCKWQKESVVTTKARNHNLPRKKFQKGKRDAVHVKVKDGMDRAKTKKKHVVILPHSPIHATTAMVKAIINHS